MANAALQQVQFVRTLNLTAKEAKRLQRAVEHFVDSFGEAMSSAEILCFEDLGYRLAGTPDTDMQYFHLGARHHDRQP